MVVLAKKQQIRTLLNNFQRTRRVIRLMGSTKATVLVGETPSLRSIRENRVLVVDVVGHDGKCQRWKRHGGRSYASQRSTTTGTMLSVYCPPPRNEVTVAIPSTYTHTTPLGALKVAEQ